jgi:shikimate kinase
VRGVFLTGFMGSGKTAVGAALAKRLGRRFIDLDAEIERTSGLTVASMFARFGEGEFRRRESRALADLGALDDAIVATGGGTVVDARNRASMRAAGWIVCLTADAETVLARVGGGEDRPLLAGASDRAAKVRALLAERAEAYADADWRIDTSGKTVEAVSREIADWLRATEGRVATRTSGR